MNSDSNRAAALFDGMNLYHHARNAFGGRHTIVSNYMAIMPFIHPSC